MTSAPITTPAPSTPRPGNAITYDSSKPSATESPSNPLPDRVSDDAPRGGASNVWAELDVDGELRVADCLTDMSHDVVLQLSAQAVDVSGVRHVDREGQREAGMVVDLGGRTGHTGDVADLVFDRLGEGSRMAVSCSPLARRWSGRVGRPDGSGAGLPATVGRGARSATRYRPMAHQNQGWSSGKVRTSSGRTGEVARELPKAPRLRASPSPPATTSSRPSRNSTIRFAVSAGLLIGGPWRRPVREDSGFGSAPVSPVAPGLPTPPPAAGRGRSGWPPGRRFGLSGGVPRRRLR